MYMYIRILNCGKTLELLGLAPRKKVMPRAYKPGPWYVVLHSLTFIETMKQVLLDDLDYVEEDTHYHQKGVYKREKIM